MSDNDFNKWVEDYALLHEPEFTIDDFKACWQAAINSIPSKQSARIAELEAQLARYEHVAYIDNVGVCAITVFMVDKLKNKANSKFPYSLWGTKLFALKDEK